MQSPTSSHKVIWILVAACVVSTVASLTGVAILLQRRSSPVLANGGASSGPVETLRVVADRDVSLMRRPNRAGLGSELDVGYRTWVNGEEEYHTALHFTLPGELHNKSIQSAKVKMYYTGAWGSFDPRAITVHGLEEDWNAASAHFTMARGPALATNVAGGGANPMWLSWEVTTAATAWAANPSRNYGLLLEPVEYGSRDNSMRFLSTRTTNEALHPVLEITFSGIR